MSKDPARPERSRVPVELQSGFARDGTRTDTPAAEESRAVLARRSRGHVLGAARLVPEDPAQLQPRPARDRPPPPLSPAESQTTPPTHCCFFRVPGVWCFASSLDRAPWGAGPRRT